MHACDRQTDGGTEGRTDGRTDGQNYNSQDRHRICSHGKNVSDVITMSRTKFGRQMQNDVPMMTQTWKSKPDVEFQHGRSLFSETGSSKISTVDWDISPKFGRQVTLLGLYALDEI